MGAAALELEVAGIYAAALGAVLAFCILVGLQYGWKYSIGGVLSIVADAFIKFNVKVWKFSSGHPLRWIGHKIEDASDGVYRGLGHGAAKSEQAAAYLWRSAGALQLWICRELELWGEAWLNGLNDLVHRDIPAARDDAVRIARKEYRGIDQLIKKTRHWVETLVARRLHALDKAWNNRLAIFRRGIDRTIQNAVKPIRQALTRANTAIANVRGITVKQARRIAALERLLAALGGATLAALRARIGRLEGRVGTLERAARATDIRAAVLKALAGLGLGFLFTSWFKDFGRRLTNTPRDLLEELLTLFTVVTGTMSLIEFAEYMIVAKEEMVDITRRFWEAD